MFRKSTGRRGRIEGCTKRGKNDREDEVPVQGRGVNMLSGEWNSLLKRGGVKHL